MSPMTSAPTIERPASAVVPGAVERMERYDARCKELAAAAGVLNATHGHLVDVAIECLAESDHVGPGLHSFAQFLCWRLGVSSTTAQAIERVARRASELPVLCATLRAGEISLEQAAVVALYVPAAYDVSATEFAKSATVTQLKTALPAYRERKPTVRKGGGVSLTTSEDGHARISGGLDADQGAVVAKALEAMREDLWRQRKADAQALAAETGEPEARVEQPTGAEALTALAESAMAHQHAAHPGSERYLITYHLQATADGQLVLLDAHGQLVEEGERRRLLCDHRFDHVLHDEAGTALSVGRTSRHINRRLRRAVLHRHHGRCAVPGCETTHGLEVHHIVHWEDGGPTDTHNLVAICRRHHRAHHQGLLHIEGNADLPADAPGSLHIGPPGLRLVPAGTPQPIGSTGAGRDADRLPHLRAELRGRLGVVAPPKASTPTGERLDRHTFHLSPAPEPVTEPDSEADDEGDGPDIHPHRRYRAPSGRRSPDGPPEAHGPPAA